MEKIINYFSDPANIAFYALYLTIGPLLVSIGLVKVIDGIVIAWKSNDKSRKLKSTFYFVFGIFLFGFIFKMLCL